jgi:hypothetical protein
MSLHSDSIAYETEDSAVVAVEQVRAHEHYHGPRVAELAARLLAEGRLINPPVVAQLGESYVVLDGATRLTALRQLGCPNIIVQVVNLESRQVQLSSWNHAIYGGSSTALLKELQEVSGLRMVPVESNHTSHEQLPAGALGHLRTVGGESFVLETQPTSAPVDVGWLRVLNALVECYGQWGNVERTLAADVELLAKQFSDLAALVIFPPFTPQMILALAEQGRTVPAGITRFVIPGRILRLNAPLEKLAGDEPLTAKQAWLDELIRTKLRERQVRYYEEPVILLDE